MHFSLHKYSFELPFHYQNVASLQSSNIWEKQQKLAHQYQINATRLFIFAQNFQIDYQSFIFSKITLYIALAKLRTAKMSSS